MRRFAVPLTVLLALAAAAPAHAGYTFAGQTPTNVGNTPVSLVTADFNDDGLADLATANCGSSCGGSGTGGANSLQNLSTGLFFPQTVANPNNPSVAYAGDLNNDGDPDFATANLGSLNVSLFVGDGVGGLGAPTTTSLNDQPRGLDFADLDGDGDRDLVAALGGASNQLQVKTNSGSLVFPSSTFLAGALDPRAVLARDFDGDGDRDLVAALGGTGRAVVYTNAGGGTFGTGRLEGVGGTPVGVAAGDFNGDGDLDLAFAMTRPSVAVLLGGTGTTFGDVATYSTGNTGNAIGIATADMNGDGILDLVTRNTGATARVLDGRGDGTFAFAGVANTGSTGTFGSSSVVARDFTADGVADIAVPNAGDNTVSLLKSVGVIEVGPVPDFADTPVGERSAPEAITIKNTGAGPMTLSTAVLGGTSAGDFAITRGCGFTAPIKSGQSCDLLVRFAPTATGSRSAQITFNQLDNPLLTQVVFVAGRGTAPPAPVVGPTGPQGPAGSNGTNGATGAQGAPGANGTNGINGAV